MARIPLTTPLFDTCENIDSMRLPEQFNESFHHKDFAVAQSFLKKYEGNKHTFGAYRRELERLIQWSWLIKKKSIIDLSSEEIETYVKFCIKPYKSWIGTKQQRRFITHSSLKIPNPQWRPFVATISKAEYKNGKEPNTSEYTLSQKSISEIFIVLSSFFASLLLEGIIAANPVSLIKQKSKYIQKQQQRAQVRRLTERQWQYCLKAAEHMADEQPEQYERLLFALTAMYLMYLRISELVASERWQPQMGHFFQDSLDNWWFKTVGKGNKMRTIAVSDSMLEALMRYREKQGLTPLPYPDEETPLMGKLNGRGAISSTRHIRRLIQLCFDKAAEKLRRKNFNDDADSLEQATVHWLRHTGISDDINKHGRSVAHVRDDAGHSSIATTDRYNDIVMIDRHRSAKDK